MKKWLKRIGMGAGALVAIVVVVLLVARSKAHSAYEKSWSIPDHEIPIPFPLSAEEIAQLEPGRDASAVATERAVERGKALVTTRLGCQDCHGADFGGAVVMDVLPVGALICPNITQGEGSVAKGYGPADWVRILRHGVGRDRTSSAMPAIDYTMLSDREISDVAAYVSSMPPVNRTMEKSRLGPVLWMQFGLGSGKFAADVIDHNAARPVLPPAEEPTKEYGKHIAQVCVGCHGMNFSGGKIAGGDPSWPAAANLTPHDSGLKGWTFEDYQRVFAEGKRPDGSDVNPVMPWKAMNAMNEVQKRAMFLFFQSLPPTPKGSN